MARPPNDRYNRFLWDDATVKAPLGHLIETSGQRTAMKQPRMLFLFAAAVSFGCNSASDSQQKTANPSVIAIPVSHVATKQQEQEIRDLVEQLVFAEGKAIEDPVLSPGVRDNSDGYRKRFETCRIAFRRLSEFRGLAFPILIEHLDDDRQSIPFRNHYLGQSVGDACYWNIYFQLQDRPRDYSRYGRIRKGRDGQDHTQPYWEGTPFGDAGGLREWLDANKSLSYTQQQIKCLNWLLEKEQAIGAYDAESYFLNILPLEIRILERKLELGQSVKPDLDRLRRMKAEKRVDEIPAELLPAN